LPEVVLWTHLRGSKLGQLRFRRQHPIGPYILDFYCASIRLCVEIDGIVHASTEQAVHDERRTRWLAERNIQVLRVAAADVLDDETLGGVLLAIEAAANSVA
ncbi:MAG: endonuclease domain-containing protein, partial [Devosia sp.]